MKEALEILDQIEKNHQVDLPQNLVDQEISSMTQNLKPNDKEKYQLNNVFWKHSNSTTRINLFFNLI